MTEVWEDMLHRKAEESEARLVEEMRKRDVVIGQQKERIHELTEALRLALYLRTSDAPDTILRLLHETLGDR